MHVSDDHGVGRSNQATRPRVLLSLYTHFDSHRFFSLFFSLVPHWLWIQTSFTSRSSSWRHHTLSSIQDRAGPLVLLYTRGTTTLWRVVMNSFRFFVSLFRFQSSVSSYPLFSLSFLAFSASPSGSFRIFTFWFCLECLLPQSQLYKRLSYTQV
jgi:hypothetical protein